MAEELDHKTFDLGPVIAGIGFPELEVDVYFNEALGFRLFQLQKALSEADLRGQREVQEELQAEIDTLKEEARGSRYVVTLRGLPESFRKIANAKARGKFAVEYSFLNQEIPDPDRDDYYNALLWQDSIVKITSPDGSIAVPNEDQILELRSSVGRSVVTAIAEGIRELQDGAKAGFESAAQDPSFLSGA